MINFIEDTSESNKLLSSSEPKLVLFRTLDSKLHDVHTKLSVLYVKTLDSEYVIALDHPDLINVFLPPKIKNAYVFDLKKLMYYVECIDCFDLKLFGNEPDSDSLLYRRITSIFNSFSNINRIIPITKQIELFQKASSLIKLEDCIELKNETSTTYNQFYNADLPRILGSIERTGLGVNLTKFHEEFPDKEHLLDGNKIYTHYNYYTSTGRPSNAHGGINFAALNKSGDIRKCFTSKYKNGQLVNIDFKSFHIFLIAKHFGINLPPDPHYEFAKYWFKTDSPTAQQVIDSKAKTFHALYSGKFDIDSPPSPIFSQDLYDRFARDYVEDNGIVTGKANRFLEIDGFSISKAFNYFIQSLELEVGLPILDSFVNNGYFRNFEPVLYTYDSMLFDLSDVSGMHIQIRQIKNHFRNTYGYPVTVEMGFNYKDMSVL